MKRDNLLIIPAYNEEPNIGSVIDALKDAEIFSWMDVVVINDGSTDRTEQVAQAHGAKVLNQCFNLGYGAALQLGYKYAMRHGYEFIFQMDADGQHDIVNLFRIRDRLCIPAGPDERQPDIVIGSRFLEGSQSFAVSKLKMFAITLFKRVIHMVTGYYVTDPTSGLQGMNRKAFGYYAAYHNFDTKYPDINMIVQMLLVGFHIVEAPAVMHERTAGESMHDSLWKVGKYMVLMALSTCNAVQRYRRKTH